MYETYSPGEFGIHNRHSFIVRRVRKPPRGSRSEGGFRGGSCVGPQRHEGSHESGGTSVQLVLCSYQRRHQGPTTSVQPRVGVDARRALAIEVGVTQCCARRK